MRACIRRRHAPAREQGLNQALGESAAAAAAAAAACRALSRNGPRPRRPRGVGGQLPLQRRHGGTGQQQVHPAQQAPHL
jgi:hypothetical protein